MRPAWLLLTMAMSMATATSTALFAATDNVPARPVVIGSKAFTESVVLGELARSAIQGRGVTAVHRSQLGGTRILWRALQNGEIDAYPEYSGTLLTEILGGKVAPDQLADALKKQGVGVTEPLGFNNTYAMGMREAQASALGIESISQLALHPDLRFGLSNEFMAREDGWPGLLRAYGLPAVQARGMSHDLAYRAIDSGAIDVMDLYSTDAEIARYDLRVLSDDRHFFPDYQALFVYRLELQQREPRALEALRSLGGRIDAAAMQAMNARAKIDRVSEQTIAAEFLGVAAQADASLTSRLWQRTREHLALVAISLLAAILVALPLGIIAAHRPRLGQLLISATGLLQTLPSLAVFVFMIPLFGIGAAPAIAALFLYSLLPIVRNTHAGITGIPRELRETAAALGLPAGFRLWRIELPLAMNTILAGIKTAAVINVGTATLGALIGAGGYGQPILTGIRLDDMGLILQGAIPAAALALLVQGLFDLLERGLTPRGLRLAPRR